MDSFVVLAIQCTCSTVIFFLLFQWYIQPRIKVDTKNAVLAFLLIINVFRYLPLSLYMPGQVSADFPDEVRDIVAHGDFLSGIFAFIALLAVRAKSRFATALIWLFSIVSIADMVLALSFAMMAKVYELPLGVNYFTVSVYVPLLMVIQYQLIRLLINKNLRPHA